MRSSKGAGQYGFRKRDIIVEGRAGGAAVQGLCPPQPDRDDRLVQRLSDGIHGQRQYEHRGEAVAIQATGFMRNRRAPAKPVTRMAPPAIPDTRTALSRPLF